MTREHYLAQLKELDQEIVSMGNLVADTICACMSALEARDAGQAQELIEADNRIDDRRYEIEKRALLLIATQQPLAKDLRTVAAILTVATELERIGDYCEGIAKLTLRMAAEPVLGEVREVHAMADITQQLLRDALTAFEQRDLEGAGDVWSRDDEIDGLYQDVFRSLIARMIADTASVRTGTYMLWVAHNIERMADRVTNVAERTAFIVTGDVSAFRERLRSRTLPDLAR